MLFKVYHANEPNFGMGKPPKFPQEFTHVANVDTATIDEVYRLTNHIGYAWWESKWVDCIKQSRSTSVGDVVVDSNGKIFRCENVGWKEITNG